MHLVMLLTLNDTNDLIDRTAAMARAVAQLQIHATESWYQ